MLSTTVLQGRTVLRVATVSHRTREEDVYAIAPAVLVLDDAQWADEASLGVLLRLSGALRQLPALLALGAGLAPHLSKAVWEGLRSMAGEFVRTPKKGTSQGRYRAAADLPMTEIALCLVSGASTVASVETGHWFASPFALLFTFGYGYGDTTTLAVGGTLGATGSTFQAASLGSNTTQVQFNAGGHLTASNSTS